MVREVVFTIVRGEGVMRTGRPPEAIVILRTAVGTIDNHKCLWGMGLKRGTASMGLGNPFVCGFSESLKTLSVRIVLPSSGKYTKCSGAVPWPEFGYSRIRSLDIIFLHSVL